MADEPPYLAVGTGVSAKYKGAFCEAKIRKIVRSVKCKVLFKHGLGSATIADDQIKGSLRTGALVEARHPEKKEFFEATITKIQDCSQYTVVFDDGDITTLRRTALCLKSGRHFAESETLDQLPLTHPEHFSTPVIGGRRGRRARIGISAINSSGDGTSDEEDGFSPDYDFNNFKEADIGRVVCVEGAEKKKQRDNWFPGLVVAPTAQDTVEIHVKDEYLVRSFKDGRYYTVPKKETTEFTRDIGSRVESNNTLKSAVEKALQFLDRDELPPHWDRELLLYGLTDTATDSEPGCDNESSDDEPREEKDHFVAQLYKFMDDSGTPMNKGPTIGSKDVDLYRLFKVVQNLGGYNRVTNQNNWKTVSIKMGFGNNPLAYSLVKQQYKKFLYSFEEFYRKLGCTMVNHPRLSRNRNRSGRSLIRDKDKAGFPTPKCEKEKCPVLSCEVVTTATPAVVNVKQESVDLPEPLPLAPMEPSKPVKVVKKPSEPLILAVKVKEEKKDEPEIPKEVKKDVKSRQIKKKETEPPEPVKVEPVKPTPSEPAVKEKKKRLFGRVTKKEKPAKTNKTDCLANTRQKRTIKERVKALVDQLKIKSMKTLAPTPQEVVDKAQSCGLKAKSKEDPTSVPVKAGKKEEAPVVVPTEEKKKGRKRKDQKEASDESITIGDKLKVYYGPTHESKVTYEAKVLNTREENGEMLYLVHYTGWNTRYDEWIKSNRIADNLSSVAGKTQRKGAQVSTLKSNPKKEKKGFNSLKGDCGSKEKESSGSSSAASGTGRQGSVGRCTTPSSVSSSSSRTKSTTTKRAYTRSSNSKKEFSASETDLEYESDCADVDSSSGRKNSASSFPGDNIKEDEPVHTYSNRRKRKVEEASTDVKADTGKLLRDEKEEELSGAKVKKSRKKSLEKNCESARGETVSTVSSKEVDRIEPEKDESYDSFTEEGPLRGFELTPSEMESKENELSCMQEFISGKLNRQVEKDKQGNEDVPTGRDFDLNQIRSELKGLDTTLSPTTVSKPVEEDKIPPPVSTSAPIQPLKESETEDVYEFKEPEPFEFEARKSSEEKGKLARRSVFEDGPKCFPSKKKSTEGISSSSKSPVRKVPTPERSPREDSFEGLTIRTCEEAFDKICASPLRAATQESVHIELQLLNSDISVYDDDNYDDDSEDRLVISERDSDNYSNISYEKDAEVFSMDFRNSIIEAPASSGPKFTPTEKKDIVKENFSKVANDDDDDVDDEDDDDMEDEALTDAIQSVIMESSDEEDPVMPTCKPLKVMSVENVENFTSSANTAEEKAVEKKLEEQIAQNKDEADKTLDGIGPTTLGSSKPKIQDESKEAKNLPPLSPVAKPSSTPEREEDIPAPSKSDEGEVSGEEISGVSLSAANKTEEDEENNIDSLLCEETIPGSPTPQTESSPMCEEEKAKEMEQFPIFKSEFVIPKAIDSMTSVLVKDSPRSKTPPTPDSSSSSVASPIRESESMSKPLIDPKQKSEVEVEETQPILAAPSMKKLPSEIITTQSKPAETRSKRAESKTARKGRRTRKKADESGKRKYGKARHHGSDSEDGYEGRGDAQTRSPRPSRYNFTCNFPPDLDSNQRINRIQQALQDLRKTYADVKSELASIDRRRKKLRRRERETAAACRA